MKLKTASVLKLSALALAIAAPLMASAESERVNGNGDATARLNIRVVVPRVLFLGVGSGASGAGLASNTTVDRITFDYSTNPLDVGGGASAVAGSVTNSLTGSSADLPVKVWSNGGEVSIASTASDTNGLTNGSGDYIPWSEITTSSDSDDLAAPVPNSGTTGATTVTGSNKITNQEATWTYKFNNTTTLPAGTYNGRLIYTASTL